MIVRRTQKAVAPGKTSATAFNAMLIKMSRCISIERNIGNNSENYANTSNMFQKYQE